MKAKCFMRDLEKVTQVVAEWVTKAENDLKTAAHTLKLGPDCPTDTVCFHAQQCAEKYLKALLVFTNIAVPKTHSLQHLMRLLQPGIQIELQAEDQRLLTSYAVAPR
jgi:HEPN domain-containing protein